LSACSKRISNVSLDAGAGWYMVQNPAHCINTTHPWTGINAVQLLACFVRGTIRVDNTFWSACYIRVAKVIRNTLACCSSVVSGATYSIRATWRRTAWIDIFCNNSH